jgi:hypothetical protein
MALAKWIQNAHIVMMSWSFFHKTICDNVRPYINVHYKLHERVWWCHENYNYGNGCVPWLSCWCCATLLAIWYQDLETQPIVDWEF